MDEILKKAKNILITAYALVLILSPASGCREKSQGRFESQNQAEKERHLKAALLFSEKCGYCHGLDVVEESRYRGEEWKDVLERMYENDRGNVLKVEDYEIILEFLKEHYR